MLVRAGRALVGRDGLGDAEVGASSPSRSRTPSRRSTSPTDGFTRARRSVTPACSVSARISCSLAEPCESMKSTATQSSTIPRTLGVDRATSRTRSSRASEVAKNRPPSSRSTTRPGDLLVARGARPAPGRTASPAPARAAASRGRVATEISQSNDRPIPTITPASTPNSSVPAMAATAIQKSKRCTRSEAAHLGHVHHPHHDRLDDQRGEHRLGQVREQRREEEQREQDDDARRDRGEAGARAGVVVQRARRQARRHRHPLERGRRRRSPCPGRPTPG